MKVCEGSSNLSGDKTGLSIYLDQTLGKLRLLGEALRLCDDIPGLLLVCVLLVAVEIAAFLQE